MKHCVNCGANMRFDIVSQQMKCDHCGQLDDPNSIDAKESEESEFFDSMIYSCSNCGGEVVADENEAAVFCPYCGDTEILHGRMTKVVKPKYIIPFKKTKDECVKIYKNLLKTAIYAPSKLRKQGVTETFRGIYMPYWSYNEEHDKSILMLGEKVKVNLMSEDVTYYDCKYDVKATYDGISFDASKVFDDELSLGIAPYDANERKEFAPGYISGFYADTYDMDKTVYESKAKSIATEAVLEELSKDKQYKKFNMEKLNPVDSVTKMLETKTKETDVAYHPVWFMATRFGNRLSYATINGQTGRAAALVPASPLKYLLFSLITTIPVYFLMNGFSMLRPDFAMLIVNLIAFFVYLIYDKELSVLHYKEASEGVITFQGGKQVKAELTKTHKVIKVLFIIACVLSLLMYISSLVFYYKPAFIIPINLFIVVDMFCLMGISIIGQTKKNELTKNRYLYLLIPIIGTIMLGVEFANPASDAIYYFVIALQLIASSITFIDLIHYHNIIATKPMPQFNRVGGDDNA